MKGRKFVIPAALALLLALAVARGGREKGPVTVTLNGKEAPVTLAEDEHVWLTVDPASVTNTEAAITLHKQGISRIGYGDPFYIARKAHYNSREWKEVPWRGDEEPDWWAFLTIVGFCPDGGPETERQQGHWDMETEMQADWADIYGTLEPGKYLFVKEIIDPENRSAGRYIGAAFTVK